MIMFYIVTVTLPQNLTHILLYVTPLEEQSSQIRLNLCSLCLQTLKRPVVSNMLLLITAAIVCVCMVKPDYQPTNMPRSIFEMCQVDRIKALGDK